MPNWWDERLWKIVMSPNLFVVCKSSRIVWMLVAGCREVSRFCSSHAYIVIFKGLKLLTYFLFISKNTLIGGCIG